MSMNLYFKVLRVAGNEGYMEFPFQTPTELSYKVMKASTLEARMKLVKDYIDNAVAWDDDTKERVWRRCWGLMNSAHLELRVG